MRNIWTFGSCSCTLIHRENMRDAISGGNLEWKGSWLAFMCVRRIRRLSWSSWIFFSSSMSSLHTKQGPPSRKTQESRRTVDINCTKSSRPVMNRKSHNVGNLFGGLTITQGGWIFSLSGMRESEWARDKINKLKKKNQRVPFQLHVYNGRVCGPSTVLQCSKAIHFAGQRLRCIRLRCGQNGELWRRDFPSWYYSRWAWGLDLIFLISYACHEIWPLVPVGQQSARFSVVLSQSPHM